MAGKSIPRHVQDFVNELSRLTRDTGVEVKSFDWSEPMAECKGGLFILTWDAKKKAYTVRDVTNPNG